MQSHEIVLVQHFQNSNMISTTYIQYRQLIFIVFKDFDLHGGLFVILKELSVLNGALPS